MKIAISIAKVIPMLMNRTHMATLGSVLGIVGSLKLHFPFQELSS